MTYLLTIMRNTSEKNKQKKVFPVPIVAGDNSPVDLKVKRLGTNRK